MIPIFAGAMFFLVYNSFFACYYDVYTSVVFFLSLIIVETFTVCCSPAELVGVGHENKAVIWYEFIRLFIIILISMLWLLGARWYHYSFFIYFNMPFFIWIGMEYKLFRKIMCKT